MNIHPDRTEIVQATIQTKEPAHCNIHVRLPRDDDRLWHPEPILVEPDEILRSVETFIGDGQEQAPTGTVVLWTRKGHEEAKREDLTVVRSD